MREAAQPAQRDGLDGHLARVLVAEQVEDDGAQSGATGGGGQSSRGDAHDDDIGFVPRQ